MMTCNESKRQKRLTACCTQTDAFLFCILFSFVTILCCCFLHYSSVFVFSNSLFQFSLTNTLIFSVHAFVFIDVHYAGLYVKYCFQYAMLRSSTVASKFQERGTNDLTFLSRKLHLQVDSRYRTARLQPLYVGFVSYPVCIVATHLKITLFICFLYLFFYTFIFLCSLQIMSNFIVGYV